MKRIFYFLIIASVLIACNTADEKSPGKILTEEEKKKAESDTTSFTTIAWLDSTSVKLGSVKKGEVVEVAFHFRNTGDKQLIITNVRAGCGCTVPEKPEKPYGPGEEGVIKAKFDSKNQHTGPHTKNVTVEANTRPNITHLLNFTVEITE